MTAGQLTDERIQTYLEQLKAALVRVLPQDSDDILREIRAHILDSSAGASDRDAAVARVLRLLGTPQDLAGRYTTECLLTRAGRSFSPWLLLRSSRRWAALGMKGTFVFLLAVFGYGLALGATIAIFLKLLTPSEVGMWIGRGDFVVGVPGHTGMHELLGHWFVPVIAVMAFLFAIGTTQALRWMIRKRGPKSPYSVPPTSPLEAATSLAAR
jgi:uncharacterized membrane protein